MTTETATQPDVQTEAMVNNLKLEIAEAITLIKGKKKSPKEADMPGKLSQLMALDLVAYRAVLEEYKPVSKEYFTEARKNDRKIQDEKRKAEYQIMTMSTRGMSGDSSGYDAMPTKYQERQRTASTTERTKKPLPEKARKAKTQKFSPVTQSNFEFNGETYGKGPLVLAVVQAHAKKNKKITHEQMKAAFPDSLLRGYGIFTTKSKAEELCKTRKRYFVKDEQMVKLADETIAVCNQFTSDNIGAFLNQAKLLGYTIK